MSEVEMNFTNNVFGSEFALNSNVQISAADFHNFTTRFNKTRGSGASSGVFESELIIPLYAIIFVLSIVGNSLVLVTLVRNKRMRTVTNVYLLNLAISDLLLGVFCMPFTLVGQVLRNFIFGATMCRLIPYFQAVSVSVGVWTLVAISLERYFAICRPLKSRRWQTQFHAYKMIAVVWLASLFWSAPVLAVSSLKAMKGRGHKCREEWPSKSSEQIFNLFLDAMLLLIPVLIMSLAYSLIMTKLWKGLRREIQHNNSFQAQMIQRSNSSPTINGELNKSTSPQSTSEPSGMNHLRPTNRLLPPSHNKAHSRVKDAKHSKKTESVKMWFMKGIVQVRLPASIKKGYTCNTQTKSTLVPRCELTTPSSEHCSYNELCPSNDASYATSSVDETTYHFTRHAIRSNYMDKSIEAKKKVIRMLFVVVAEFFICWAPLHILNTWYLFYPEDVYLYVGSTGISLVQLLAYISSCCNPITYCFMNRKFRQAFLAIFNWYNVCYCCVCMEPKSHRTRTKTAQKNGIHKIIQNNSDVSCNESTIYIGRQSTIGRSEVVVLEAEDRV
ncbi:cholecystokinin receptor type A isoform X2 [Tribolium castaneum]|uniref:Gastrin/cholecystokinin type B receptor n=1 Tax=Tribolium castaneum TaxID=7070 RepID=D2A3E1_TRICA|nr:PREDICTED: cholecystokinin receptor type A isoform X2 [Tribolium castaneum]EFA02835.2 Tyramine/octopamine receptor-like Protein [Tribolium castaneum]|eukprot:XP_015835017.1 PREDICTED: cholecystokinin receptor type A isoform X2 [Tribolium castaneum]